MTHPKYSERYLLKKGISYCKLVAKELGVTPEGDKRQLIVWIDAIIEHQSKIQPAEPQQEAVIEYSESETTEPYLVKVNGEIVHQRSTYMNAYRYAQSHGYKVVEPQQVAQAELEAAIEAQAEEVAPTPEVVITSPTGFGYFEAELDSEVVGEISQDFDTSEWLAVIGQHTTRFASYAEAESFVKQNYQVLNKDRGSGRSRVPTLIEDMGLSIEDMNFVDPKGQTYAVRARNTLAGYIWLSDDNGWTLNGSDFAGDWQPVAQELLKLTKHEYLLAA